MLSISQQCIACTITECKITFLGVIHDTGLQNDAQFVHLKARVLGFVSQKKKNIYILIH